MQKSSAGHESLWQLKEKEKEKPKAASKDQSFSGAEMLEGLMQLTSAKDTSGAQVIVLSKRCAVRVEILRTKMREAAKGSPTLDKAVKLAKLKSKECEELREARFMWRLFGWVEFDKCAVKSTECFGSFLNGCIWASCCVLSSLPKVSVAF